MGAYLAKSYQWSRKNMLKTEAGYTVPLFLYDKSVESSSNFNLQVSSFNFLIFYSIT